MAMSKDRVKFVLPRRYYLTQQSSNGMHRDTCKEVLLRAFNMQYNESERLMRGAPDQGFTIICRPSQFARFIVYRHDARECINGVRDLKPVLVPGDEITDPYCRIVQETGVLYNDVRAVMLAANKFLVLKVSTEPFNTEIDVSKRHDGHRGRGT